MNNEPNTEPITEITEAPMETKEALIDTNKTDIQPISFSIEDAPEHLEKETPKKKPRSEKQIIAFQKAQDALKAKRLLRKQEKESAPKPKRGRPPKKILPIEEKEDEDEEEDEEDEDDDIQEEVYITTRRKGSSKRPKQKPKPKRRIVYVSESSSSEESESEDEEEEEHRNAWSHTPVNVSPYAGLRFL